MNVLVVVSEVLCQSTMYILCNKLDPQNFHSAGEIVKAWSNRLKATLWSNGSAFDPRRLHSHSGDFSCYTMRAISSEMEHVGSKVDFF
jgi:hypothetical protein